jgi:hypothetical protein
VVFDTRYRARGVTRPDDLAQELGRLAVYGASAGRAGLLRRQQGWQCEQGRRDRKECTKHQPPP